MLIIARRFRDLRFGELMQVYADSIVEAATDWPDLPRGMALQMAEQDCGQYLREVFFLTPDAFCALWEVDGRYVSALRLEPYRDGMLLAALETAPHHRKKGYASQLIRQVQLYMRQSGPVKIYSHVGKKNVASRAAHESCGFRKLHDYAVYLNGSMDYRCDTLLYEA